MEGRSLVGMLVLTALAALTLAAPARAQTVGPDGARSRVQLKQGVPYFRNAGVEHDVINANAFEFAFVEIELK